MLTRRWVMFCVLALAVLCGSGGISYWVYHAQRDELVSDAGHELTDATVAFTQALNSVFEPALTLGGTVADSGIRHAPPNQWPTLFFAIATGPVRQFERMNGAFLGNFPTAVSCMSRTWRLPARNARPAGTGPAEGSTGGS